LDSPVAASTVVDTNGGSTHDRVSTQGPIATSMAATPIVKLHNQRHDAAYWVLTTLKKRGTCSMPQDIIDVCGNSAGVWRYDNFCVQYGRGGFGRYFSLNNLLSAEDHVAYGAMPETFRDQSLVSLRGPNGEVTVCCEGISKCTCIRSSPALTVAGLTGRNWLFIGTLGRVALEWLPLSYGDRLFVVELEPSAEEYSAGELFTGERLMKEDDWIYVQSDLRVERFAIPLVDLAETIHVWEGRAEHAYALCSSTIAKFGPWVVREVAVVRPGVGPGLGRFTVPAQVLVTTSPLEVGGNTVAPEQTLKIDMHKAEVDLNRRFLNHKLIGSTPADDCNALAGGAAMVTQDQRALPIWFRALLKRVWWSTRIQLAEDAGIAHDTDTFRSGVGYRFPWRYVVFAFLLMAIIIIVSTGTILGMGVHMSKTAVGAVVGSDALALALVLGAVCVLIPLIERVVNWWRVRQLAGSLSRGST